MEISLPQAVFTVAHQGKSFLFCFLFILFFFNNLFLTVLGPHAAWAFH